MTDDSAVECAEHGSGARAIVCQHLPAGRGVGFNQVCAPDEPDCVFPDAWCDACEAVLDREGEWNDRAQAFANLRVLCSDCYMRARSQNWPSETHVEMDALIERSLDYLKSRQDEWQREFRLEDCERYDWNQDRGELVFSRRGSPVVVADIQFVGSVSNRTKTWMWSWANDSFHENVRSRIRGVREYGEEHRLLKLACAYWNGEEVDGWEMTAVSASLLEAKGAYRSPHDHGAEFMVLTDIRWAN